MSHEEYKFREEFFTVLGIREEMVRERLIPRSRFEGRSVQETLRVHGEALGFVEGEHTSALWPVGVAPDPGRTVVTSLDQRFRTADPAEMFTLRIRVGHVRDAYEQKQIVQQALRATADQVGLDLMNEGTICAEGGGSIGEFSFVPGHIRHGAAAHEHEAHHVRDGSGRACGGWVSE